MQARGIEVLGMHGLFVAGGFIEANGGQVAGVHVKMHGGGPAAGRAAFGPGKKLAADAASTRNFVVLVDVGLYGVGLSASMELFFVVARSRLLYESPPRRQGPAVELRPVLRR